MSVFPTHVALTHAGSMALRQWGPLHLTLVPPSPYQASGLDVDVRDMRELDNETAPLHVSALVYESPQGLSLSVSVDEVVISPTFIDGAEVGVKGRESTRGACDRHRPTTSVRDVSRPGFTSTSRRTAATSVDHVSSIKRAPQPESRHSGSRSSGMTYVGFCRAAPSAAATTASI